MGMNIKMNETKVRELLKEHDATWKDFEEFMHGQTVGINEDGSIDYYDSDIERYLASKYRGF